MIGPISAGALAAYVFLHLLPSLDEGADDFGVAGNNCGGGAGPGAFGTHVVVHSDLVARVPDGLTDEQAATIPIAFLTAHHALHDCARIREGESVLMLSLSVAYT